jgi:hypothetical protein
MNRHNEIEHDASFTRSDLALGSNVAVNTSLISTLLSFSQDSTFLTPADIAAARHLRLKDSFTKNPSVTLKKKQTDACWREGALISLVLGDADGTGKVRVDWLKEWFVKERLPFALGWKPASPAQGIIANVKFTDKYKALEKGLNEKDTVPFRPSVPRASPVTLKNTSAKCSNFLFGTLSHRFWCLWGQKWLIFGTLGVTSDAKCSVLGAPLRVTEHLVEMVQYSVITLLEG